MISASSYLPVYLLIVLFLTMMIVSSYTKAVVLDAQRTRVSRTGFALAFMLLLVLFIGYRPINGKVFQDTAGYYDCYNAIVLGYADYFDNHNFIFDELFAYMAKSGVPVRLFFLLMSTLYFGGIFFACKKLFPRDVLLSFLVYLAAFSTFSYGVNGLKAGVAASLFLIAVAYKDKKVISLLFLVLSLGFHHAMVVPIVAYVCAYFVQNRKYYLYFWIFCLIMAALHITSFMSFLSGFTDEEGAIYLQEGENVSGFRPDFILYSAIPIFVGYYLVYKYEIKSASYDFIWNIYTLANSVFLMTTYGIYINRIAYLSWLLYPIVLIYPFLNCIWGEKQNKYLKYAVWGHLAFTIFMVMIYYG